VYAVHLRLATHPGRLCRKPWWAEPPLGLGYHRGHYEIIGQATGLDVLTRWALSFGACAEVIGPSVLQARVAREARRVVTRYDKICYDGTCFDEATM
jgi:predicted DNA-binding transcriptional regulator YafY